jgi:hypothetical protein
MQKLTTEAQRTQSFSWEMFFCDLCASVVRNLHHETGKLFQTHSLASLVYSTGSGARTALRLS